jgi:hypothetical protein
MKSKNKISGEKYIKTISILLRVKITCDLSYEIGITAKKNNSKAQF